MTVSFKSHEVYNLDTLWTVLNHDPTINVKFFGTDGATIVKGLAAMYYDGALFVAERRGLVISEIFEYQGGMSITYEWVKAGVLYHNDELDLNTFRFPNLFVLADLLRQDEGFRGDVRGLSNLQQWEFVNELYDGGYLQQAEAAGLVSSETYNGFVIFHHGGQE